MDKKKFGITVIVIVLLVGLCFGGYYLFSGEKKENKNGTTPVASPTAKPKKPGTIISFASKTELKEENQLFSITQKDVNIRKDKEGNLYVNDQLVKDVKADLAYVADCIIMFVKEDSCGLKFSYVVDKDGKSVPFNDLKGTYRDFRMIGDEFVITEYKECNCKNDTSDSCPEPANLRLDYDGDTLSIANT